MTISSSRVALTAAGTTLVASNGAPAFGSSRTRRYRLYNAGAAVAYFGDNTVGTATGASLGSGTAMVWDLEAGESLHATVGSGTANIEILRGGE